MANPAKIGPTNGAVFEKHLKLHEINSTKRIEVSSLYTNHTHLYWIVLILSRNRKVCWILASSNPVLYLRETMFIE